MGRVIFLSDSSFFTFFSKVKSFLPNQWLHQQTEPSKHWEGKKQFSVFFVFLFFLHPPIFQTLTRKSPSFNNACHKNMYKCFFFCFSLSTYLFSIMYMSERNVKSETVLILSEGVDFFPSPADRSGRYGFEGRLLLKFLRV